MVMLASHGARERTATDFIELFRQADARFVYVGQTGGINGAFQSLLEFRFEPATSDKQPGSGTKSAVNGFNS